MIIHEVATPHKQLAFTFDDGPDPVHTARIAAAFERHRGRATFFVLGGALERHPDVARALHAGGHELGNHSYSHPRLTELDEDARREELERTDALIRDIAGVRPTSFRAPFLATDDALEALAASYGYAHAGGLNLDSMDWASPGVEHIAATVRAAFRAGAVILLHDGGDREQTAEAIERLLPEAVAAGFELVTFAELRRQAAEASPA